MAQNRNLFSGSMNPGGGILVDCTAFPLSGERFEVVQRVGVQ